MFHIKVLRFIDRKCPPRCFDMNSVDDGSFATVCVMKTYYHQFQEAVGAGVRACARVLACSAAALMRDPGFQVLAL